MTAVPGPQQPDEVRHERFGGSCMDCGGIKWPCPTEVRRRDAHPAAPSAQPDEVPHLMVALRESVERISTRAAGDIE